MSSHLGVIWALDDPGRLGKPTALMDGGNASFLAKVTSSLRDGGCDGIVLVDRKGGGLVQAAATAAGVHTITAQPEKGIFPTLREATRVFQPEPMDQESFLVLHPVNRPLVEAVTITELILHFRDGGEERKVLRPSFQEEGGFPVLLRADALEQDPSSDALTSLESLPGFYEEEGQTIAWVEVADSGVVTAIDSLATYRRHFPQSYRKRFQKW